MDVKFYMNKDFKGGKQDKVANPQYLINNVLMKKNKELVVFVGVKNTTGNIPYYFEVHGGGLFRFKKLPTKQLLAQFATINCPAIIFPYIRETIADLTRRAGFEPLHLKPVNFVELAKQVSKGKAEQEKKKAVKKKTTKRKTTAKKTS